MQRIKILLAALLVFASFGLAPAFGDDTSPMMTDVTKVRSEWERLKFTIPEGAKLTQLMDQLGTVADQLPQKYPDSAEAYIWDGIITSERASMASTFHALGLAKTARDLLEKAYAMDPKALDAGAPTSLAVLYYRVPGFPLGFGDKKRARALFEEAMQSAPQSLDTHYFYGDFLAGEHEYAHARQVLQEALTLPENPDRPLWDHNRRLVIQRLLDTIQAKS
jgi:tetratricopeptide (TPR) repeat protein